MTAEVRCLFIFINKSTDTLSVNDSHRRCDSATADGCDRCCSPPLSYCCNLCSPLEFTKYTVPLVKVKGTRRSKHPSQKCTADHEALANALVEWRETKALELLGVDIVAQHGTQILMDDTIVDTIVNCLSTMRIASLADLQAETTWPTEWVRVCGDSVLSVILQHYPLPDNDEAAKPHANDRAATSVLPSTSLVRTRAPVKCRECGISGHNSTSLIIPYITCLYL